MIHWQPGVTLEEVEKSVIIAAMRFFHGNKTQAAKSLGISVRTIHNKIAVYEGREIETEEDGVCSEGGVHLESTDQGDSEEQPVPMREPSEIQKVLPTQDATKPQAAKGKRSK